MNISETIVLGVVSGIFTSAFIFLCVNVFNKILIPWYRSIIYSGIDLSGSWEEIIEHSNAIDQGKIELSQKDRTVTGIQTIVKTIKPGSEVQTKILAITGHFQDGHLLLTANNTSRKIQSLNTYLLRIEKGGAALIGQSSWVDANTGEICSRDAVLYRLNV